MTPTGTYQPKLSDLLKAVIAVGVGYFFVKWLFQESEARQLRGGRPPRYAGTRWE